MYKSYQKKKVVVRKWFVVYIKKVIPPQETSTITQNFLGIVLFCLLMFYSPIFITQSGQSLKPEVKQVAEPCTWSVGK